MKCTSLDCDQEALFSYVWAWGENGVCCERHRFILNQQSTRLNRPVTIVPLEPGAPEPVRRDERIGYHARVMALEEELQELQARNLTIHESLTELTRQNRTLVAQKATLESELQEQRDRVGDLAEQLGKSQQTAARLQSESDRLARRLSAYEVEADPLPDVTVGGFPARPL